MTLPESGVGQSLTWWHVYTDSAVGPETLHFRGAPQWCSGPTVTIWSSSKIPKDAHFSAASHLFSLKNFKGQENDWHLLVISKWCLCCIYSHEVMINFRGLKSILRKQHKRKNINYKSSRVLDCVNSSERRQQLTHTQGWLVSMVGLLKKEICSNVSFVQLIVLRKQAYVCKISHLGVHDEGYRPADCPAKKNCHGGG